MVHGEHNKSRNSGGFALIIMGALMLIIGPQEAIVPKSLSVIVWVGGIMALEELDFILNLSEIE